MTRLFMAGAEISSGSETIATPETQPTNVGTVTRDTTVLRSGLASYKFVGTSGSTGSYVTLPTTATINTTYYFRLYVNFTNTAGGSGFTTLIGTSNVGASNLLGVYYLATGLYFRAGNGFTSANASVAINDGKWHRIDWAFSLGAAATTCTFATCLVDGETLDTFSGSTTVGGGTMSVGCVPGQSSGLIDTNFTCWVDDIACNNGSGSVNNTYLGDGKVVILQPISDSAVGSGWTTSGASSTGLWDNVNNYPPTGIADTTANAGHQIRNASSNSASYDANLGAYTLPVASGGGGLGPASIINAIQPWIATGAPVATAAKTGSVGIVSNPTIANIALTANSGDFWTGTAAGTYGTGWKWSAGTMTEKPGFVPGTSPVMRVTITGGTASRIAIVCSMVLLVEYIPEHRQPAIDFADPAFF